MRMYDVAMKDKDLHPQILYGLSQSKVIAMDNVAEYLSSTGRNLYARDMPNMAPIFPEVFIDLSSRDHCKAWFKVEHITKAGFYIWECADPTCIRREQAKTKTTIRWSLHAVCLFLCNRCDSVHIPDIAWTLNLDEFGRWAQATRPYYSYSRNPWTNVPMEVEPEDLYEFSQHIIPALFAISLMHTKNSSLVDIEPPAKLSKKHQQRYGQALSTLLISLFYSEIPTYSILLG